MPHSTSGATVRPGTDIWSYPLDMQAFFGAQHKTQDRGPDVDMRNFSVFKHGKIPSTQCWTK
jgi:hypothetical protein